MLGLNEMIENKEKGIFMNDVNFTCTSDSYWFGKLSLALDIA